MVVCYLGSTNLNFHHKNVKCTLVPISSPNFKSNVLVDLVKNRLKTFGLKVQTRKDKKWLVRRKDRSHQHNKLVFQKMHNILHNVDQKKFVI